MISVFLSPGEPVFMELYVPNDFKQHASDADSASGVERHGLDHSSASALPAPNSPRMMVVTKRKAELAKQ